MELLEYYEAQLPKNEIFIPRKYHISKDDRKLNIFGVRGAGKTAIVLDYLLEHNNEQILYIDFENPNLILNSIESDILKRYIIKNNIDILVLDHYSDALLSSFPSVQQLIVITHISIEKNSFSSKELFPLDYEEFLAFENSSIQKRGFNHFIRSGTLPAIARSQKSSHLGMKNFFQSSFNIQEQKLLLILAQHHTKYITINQIYTFAKEKFKISKDWLYKTIKEFTKEKIVIFLENSQKQSGKKMLLFDFAFAKYLTIGEPFIIQFDSMIALTLIKNNIYIETLGIHSYIINNNELIISAPFESEDSLWVKSQNRFNLYKEHQIEKVTIVTVSSRYQYDIEKIGFEALPFDEWSIIYQENS